jgi:type I restriction enzyme S subunit
MSASGSLPRGWVTAELREILLPTSTVDPKREESGEFVYIDIEAIDNQQQRIGEPKRMPNALAPSRARNKLASGDVLFSLVRPYLKNIALIPRQLDGAVGSTAFFVCRPATGVDSRFLHSALRRDSFISSVPTYGSSPPAARDIEFERQRIPLAPSSEQVRIADALDELLSDLDAGVAALERVKKKLAHYRSSVLKAAVEGALTAEWRKQHPDVEPASVLLDRILTERRHRWEEDQLRKFKETAHEPPKGWKAKYKEPAAPHTDVLPELPDGWSWATVDQCSTLIQYGSSAKTAAGSVGVPVLRMGNIKHDGGLELDELKYLPADHAEFPELLLQPGDLLFNRTNSAELVGKTARYRGTPQPCSFASYLIRVRTIEGIAPDIVAYALNSSVGRNWIKKVVNQTVGQANVNGSKLAAFVLPVPPLPEQEAIVEAVEDQVSVIDHLEKDVETKLVSAKALRQAILRHAFTGQLVPQDLNDEPASELLTRIAAEREERGREARTTKTVRKRVAQAI